ncbi:MAG: phytanoyl-CoA dioxygenase family protein [Pseudomonadota bacterium]
MVDALKFDIETVDSITDPTTGSGDVFLFPDALGQEGRPYVFMVEDPPHKTRARHYHHADVLYVYTKGEHHIEGEGTYRAGDLRWTRAGHAYGPETTGPDGGAWWVISYADPIPVDVESDEAGADTPAPAVAPNTLPEFAAPYDWPAIDAAVRDVGGAIVKSVLDEARLVALDKDIDRYLLGNEGSGGPQSGSGTYDMFLGKRTIRLHGLVEKVASTAELIGDTQIVSWAERMMGGVANSVLLNAGELIQIEPGEPAQFPHRDTDSWPALPLGSSPMLVNAIYALDDFTTENGATHVAPGSWNWDEGRRPTRDEYARAVMKRGDALLFRGDVIHGGGENASTARRRALSISYCAGWLRTVENSFLNIPLTTVRTLPINVQNLLGYSPHDATNRNGGLVGLYECGDPQRAISG